MLSYTYSLQGNTASKPGALPTTSSDVYFHNTTVNSAVISPPVQSKYGSKTRLGNPRIYDCSQCSRAFTREEHLTRHTLSTHNKLKPFACGICLRAFLRRDLLLRHAKNLHGGSELAVMRLRKSYKASDPTNVTEMASGTPINTLATPVIPLASPSCMFQYSAGHIMEPLLSHDAQLSPNIPGFASMSPLSNPRSSLDTIHLAPIAMALSISHDGALQRSRFSPFEQPESRLKMSVLTLVG